MTWKKIEIRLEEDRKKTPLHVHPGWSLSTKLCNWFFHQTGILPSKTIEK